MAEVVMLADCARYSLRGNAEMLSEGCESFGVPLPPMLRVARAGFRTAFRLGPDEVLLRGPEGALPPNTTPVVDVGERQVAFLISGRPATPMVAAGCPLDVERMEVDQVSRSLLGKAEIVLWRSDADEWHLEVWRSFAAYVRALIAQAARDWP